LSEGRARSFARHVGAALDYCHRNNITHGSLTVHHIIVTGQTEAQLTGFGHLGLFDSRFYSKASRSVPQLECSGIPENNGGAGPEFDVWGFGTVIYALVCGYRADLEIELRHGVNLPDDLSEGNGTLHALHVIY
jgi:serine/threonine protein kinase